MILVLPLPFDLTKVPIVELPVTTLAKNLILPHCSMTGDSIELSNSVLLSLHLQLD